jgi:prophage regulatory protein
MQNARTKEIIMHDTSSSDVTTTLVRLPQILKVLPISKSKFWQLVRSGEFPKPIKIGRSSFWTLEQTQAFIKEKAMQSNN